MEAYPTIGGGLSAGFSTGVNNALTLSSIVAQKKQEERAKQEMDMKQREQQFSEIEKGLAISTNEKFSPETRAKFYNGSVVKNANALFGAGLQEVDSMPDELTPTLKEAKAMVDSLKKGEISATDAKSMMADLVARHPTLDKQLEPVQELLKTGQQQDFEMKKQHDEQAFQASQERAKAARKANEEGPTFTKIEGEIIMKYRKDPTSLTPQEQKIIDNRLVDPTFSSVLNLYSNNMINQTKKPEVQIKEIQDMMQKVTDMQKMGFSVTPAETPAPPPPAGAPGVVPPPTAIPVVPQGTPRALPEKGDVLAGYEFAGGDPTDKKNWKKKAK